MSEKQNETNGCMENEHRPESENASSEEEKRKQAARSWLAQYIESIRAGIK